MHSHKRIARAYTGRGGYQNDAIQQQKLLSIPRFGVFKATVSFQHVMFVFAA